MGLKNVLGDEGIVDPEETYRLNTCGNNETPILVLSIR